MEVILQNPDEILASLNPLDVEWKDDVAQNVIARLHGFPVKGHYTNADIKELLDEDFREGILICGLFLGLSKDRFQTALAGALGSGGIGIKRYQADPGAFLEALDGLGLLDEIASQTTRELHWSDTLVERLRSGRGSAISGQRRGRGVEDFAEGIIKKVFEDSFDSRCNFRGPHGQAKCDFAIPSKNEARIIVEAKGYGATGSKMTDVIGDIEKIIAAKRSDTAFLFFTDGIPWRSRRSDLAKIVSYQNAGDIMRIYTSAMAEHFENDLRQLKAEYRL